MSSVTSNMMVCILYNQWYDGVYPLLSVIWWCISSITSHMMVHILCRCARPFWGTVVSRRCWDTTQPHRTPSCRRSLSRSFIVDLSTQNWSELNAVFFCCCCYTPAPPKVERGYTGFTLMSVRPSVCPSVRLSVRPYKFCYNIQWIYFTIWEKGKEELWPLQYHFKSLHIISRHYKKSLLRSQIYHGYEELSTDINYPIWRRQKLPYMKKTRKKKQVCGAACFMAAEIKFSEDVRL